MQFKKSTSILIAFVILFSNLGLALNVHYCKDKIAGISFTTQIEEICKADVKSCCVAENPQNKCCSNKIIKAEKQNDELLSSHFNVKFQPFYFEAFRPYSFLEKSVFSSKNELISFYCDSNAPPFYKLYCQLVLYA